MSARADHAEVQRRYFEHADVERYAWTTGAPGFADTEDALVGPLLDDAEGPCLEIGCGEGNNLVRLARRVACTGVDLFPAKLHFAAREIPAARFAASDAGTLPFRAGVFRTVFIRDLLHHVPAPHAVLAEAMRVLAPGGRFILLEPNGRNPLVNLQTRIVPAEAAARRFGPAYIRGLLEPLPLATIDLRMLQPLPLRRLALHYRCGLPALGRIAATRRALVAIEALLARLLPASRWAYVAAVATRAPTR